MTKTVIIPDDIHLLIIKKQIDIRERYGISPRITDMIVAYIKAGIGRTDELLNLIDGSDTNKNDSRISLVEEADIRA